MAKASSKAAPPATIPIQRARPDSGSGSNSGGAKKRRPRVAEHRCTCEGYWHPDPEAHHPHCVGRTPTGWRARVPEFTLPEVHAIDRGQPPEAPLYRLVVRDVIARAREAS